MAEKKGLLSILPPADNGRTGWPWDVESDPSFYKDGNYPKVSVITPSFNQDYFLEETIRSILLQNYPNVELVIIDGGSTDRTLEVIKKYEPWITYWVSEKDRGQSHAINKGKSKVTGDFIGWQNSDDIYFKDAFAYFTEARKLKPDQDVYFGNMKTIDKRSDDLDTNYYSPFDFNEIKFSGWNITNQSCFFSKRIFDQITIREEFRYVMDGALYFEVASKTNKFYHIKKFLGGFRLHDDAKSSNINMTTGWNEWVKLRAEYGITMKQDVPWEKQFVFWKKWFKIRKGMYYLKELLLKQL